MRLPEESDPPQIMRELSSRRLIDESLKRRTRFFKFSLKESLGFIEIMVLDLLSMYIMSGNWIFDDELYLLLVFSLLFDVQFPIY